MLVLAHDVLIGEIAHDLADGIRLADVGEELVAQAGAIVGTLHQTGDVDELHRGGHDAAGMHDIRQRLQAIVRYVHDTDVGIDGGKGIVGR